MTKNNSYRKPPSFNQKAKAGTSQEAGEIGQKQNGPQNGSRRRYFGGRLVGAFISEVTRPAFKKKSPLLVRMVMDWEHLIGQELAARSEPRSLRDGVLTIGCLGPVAMELRYASPQILERLNIACGLYGEARLHGLRIKQDMTIKTQELPRKRPSPLPVHLPGFGPASAREKEGEEKMGEEEENPLRAVLERLGGHIAAREALRKTKGGKA